MQVFWVVNFPRWVRGLLQSCLHKPLGAQVFLGCKAGTLACTGLLVDRPFRFARILDRQGSNKVMCSYFAKALFIVCVRLSGGRVSRSHGSAAALPHPLQLHCPTP
jgi:hypothetical protein